MTLRNILIFPDPRLRTQAKPVTHINENIRQLCADMIETMYHADGIGLAATQINVHLRVIVTDTSEQKNAPQIFINPKITVLDPHLIKCEEGCLSVPEINEPVSRPTQVQVDYLDQDNQAQTNIFEDLMATCIQHEIDHLNGKLFVDYLSTLKRARIKHKLEKYTQNL